MTKADITEVKSLNNPPAAVVVVIAGCVILFEAEIKKNGGEITSYTSKSDGKKHIDYWSIGKKNILNHKFLEMLVKFDKDNVSSKTLFKLREKVFNDPSITY